jgi:hypothetical protein
MNPVLPLTEPQERRLTVTLAELERRLAGLRETLDHPPDDLRLIRHKDHIRADEAAALRQRIDAAHRRLCQMADSLGLKGSSDSLRRTFLAGLELASISLYEAHPSGEMRGCGELAPASAAYLETEFPQLEVLVREVIQLLERGVQPRLWGKGEHDQSESHTRTR